MIEAFTPFAVTKAEKVAAAIRRRVKKGQTLAEAAREVQRLFPDTCIHALQEIGPKPHADPELRALQRL